MTKLAYHPFIISIVSLIAIIFFFSLDKSSHKTEISTQNIKVLEEEVHNMSSDIDKLEEKIIETDSDLFKEKVIRNELLLQKPGEHIIQIPDLESLDKENIDIKNSDKPIDQWLELIF